MQDIQADDLERLARPTVRPASGRCVAGEWNHSVIVKASLRTPQRASGADADSGRETWWATVNSTALDSRGRSLSRWQKLGSLLKRARRWKGFQAMRVRERKKGKPNGHA